MGGLSPPQPTCPTAAVSIPGFCQCSLRATYPLCPEPRRPAAFTAPHLAPPSASALWPLHSPFHTISPRAPRVLRPSAACPGKPSQAAPALWLAHTSGSFIPGPHTRAHWQISPCYPVMSDPNGDGSGPLHPKVPEPPLPTPQSLHPSTPPPPGTPLYRLVGGMGQSCLGEGRCGLLPGLEQEGALPKGWLGRGHFLTLLQKGLCCFCPSDPCAQH